MNGSRITPGLAAPLGAHCTPQGVNFALRSRVATRVELCLVTDDGVEQRVPLAQSADRFHVHIEGLGPGTRYGFRVHGPHDPARGSRCDPAKLLLDPSARRLMGPTHFHPSQVCAPDVTQVTEEQRDSFKAGLFSVVVGSDFDWQGDRRPATPWSQTILYECQIKGMTALHPEVAPSLRVTYLGLCSPPIL